MIKTDIHQHVWSEPLIEALAERSELPYVRFHNGLTVLYLAGERPYVIDSTGEDPAHRAALVESDGLDRALVCLSSPLGIESLPRSQALGLIDAYYEGAFGLGEPFGVWGAIALDALDCDDVDRALDRGCVGLSVPAGALAGVEAIGRLRPALARLESLGAPLFVHPGPGGFRDVWRSGEASLRDPLWWPALTHYVAQMQAAWLTFVAVGRAEHPGLRVIFSMLAGLAPLQTERLRARGGPNCNGGDDLLFYDTSSYGLSAVGTMRASVGASQLLYGSDRPVVEPDGAALPGELDWAHIGYALVRALGAAAPSESAVAGR
jgi:hypothetical protein